MLQTTLEKLANGRRLRVARLGSGPPLVLLHGYPDNLQIWCELAPRLADRCQVIALDWPGMGSSDAWPGGATPAHMADRLRTLLDIWGIKRAGLVGMDMGGQPALVFAARHPERVRQLVVMNSLVYGDEPTSWEIRVLRRFGWNRFILRRLPRLVFRRAERTFLPRGVRLPEDLRTDLWATFRRPEVRAIIAKMCAGYQGTLPRLPEDYARIACPTLVLWGERDKHFPPIHAVRLHAAIPGSCLRILPGADHWMAWYRAEEVARQIGLFLNPMRSVK
jgi:pimeloyl-ACP methyl ester carboxylesterase